MVSLAGGGGGGGSRLSLLRSERLLQNSGMPARQFSFARVARQLRPEALEDLGLQSGVGLGATAMTQAARREYLTDTG